MYAPADALNVFMKNIVFTSHTTQWAWVALSSKVLSHRANVNPTSPQKKKKTAIFKSKVVLVYDL